MSAAGMPAEIRHWSKGAGVAVDGELVAVFVTPELADAYAAIEFRKGGHEVEVVPIVATSDPRRRSNRARAGARRPRR